MKKKAIIPVIILLILFIAVIWYTFPKEIPIPGNNNVLGNGLGPLVYTGIANDLKGDRDSENGYMNSAPADNREDALIIQRTYEEVLKRKRFGITLGLYAHKFCLTPNKSQINISKIVPTSNKAIRGEKIPSLPAGPVFCLKASGERNPIFVWEKRVR